MPPLYIPPEERKTKTAQEGDSLASIIDAAEAAKGRKDFPEAIRLFQKAIDTQVASKKATGQETKPDVFLAQRLALVTYKNGETKDAEGNLDKDRAIAALGEAEQILGRYCAPKISTDPETLGLSGAINKRLFDLTGDLDYLDQAIAFYERGFYVKQDYYNGINVAFMYTMRSLLLEDRFDAIVSYGHANMIRRKVGEICTEIIDDEEEFHKRGDQQWVLMTLGEVYPGPRPERRRGAAGTPHQRGGGRVRDGQLHGAEEEAGRSHRRVQRAGAPGRAERGARRSGRRGPGRGRRRGAGRQRDRGRPRRRRPRRRPRRPPGRGSSRPARAPPPWAARRSASTPISPTGRSGRSR